ncbi:MAG TPA: MFS transporter [Pyrinomonadaceae bacterium]|nr:MFS transporter [Pyrinomonadaceae bacterium]
MTYRQLLGGNANFRHLWSGQVVSEIGDWLNNIAVLALVLELAGPARQGRAIAVYAIARHLPLFLFGPIAGVVVDRTDRRRVMIAADAARAVLAAGFLVAQHFSSLPAIYAVGASLFAVSAFFNAAKRATIPVIVTDADELLGANSLSVSTTAATIAVGSALGGLVATFISRDLVFVLNAATFLVSAWMISRIRLPRRQGAAESSPLPLRAFAPLREVSSSVEKINLMPRRKGTKEDGEAEGETKAVEIAARETSGARAASSHGRVATMQHRIAAGLRRAFDEFCEGLRYVRRDGVLMAVFIVAAGWGLGNGVARALYSVFGARLGELTASAWAARPRDFGISVLFVAMGVGGVLGAPVARRFNAAGDSLGARMGRSLVLDGCGLALFTVMPNLWTASLILIAREMNFAIWWTAQQTLVMRRTDNAYAGRVFASYETLTTLTMVSSMYAAGAGADAFGIRPVAAAGGFVIAFSGLLWFLLRRRDRRRALAQTDAPHLST